MNQNTEIFGLVLAGGRSTRMGTDKGLLQYHNQPQREYLYEQLQGLCNEVYMSIRPEQASEIPDRFKCIADENLYRGPLNGLLSAHHAFPKVAWLVVACDLPLVDKKVLKYLLDRRDKKAMATAFATRKTGLPEPLAAIWEPHGLQQAENHIKTAESSCPRKFLLNVETSLVYPEDDLWVANANEPEEHRRLLTKLSEK